MTCQTKQSRQQRFVFSGVQNVSPVGQEPRSRPQAAGKQLKPKQMQHDCTLFALWKTGLFWKKRTGKYLFTCIINYKDRMWCRKRTIANSNIVVPTNFPACSHHLGFWKRRKTEWSCGFVLHADAATPYIVGPTMLGVVASVLAVVCKGMQQLPTTCNKVCKRTQHVTSHNIWSCWLTMLRPFARGFKLDNVARLVTLRSHWSSLRLL